MSQKIDKNAFPQIYLAKALEGEVQAWVNEGWPGITKTTLELFNYWFSKAAISLSIAKDKATIDFEKKIKRAFDSDDILNSGKIFPE